MSKKILIIDDDKNISDLYLLAFTAAGYEIKAAENASRALERIAGGFTPDAILLDIIMPGENGIELLNKLVADPKLSGTKILLFSNLDHQSDLDDSLRKKIAGYYLKVDMTPSEMVEKMKELLG